MSTEVTIGANASLFVGEDKTLELEVLDAAGAPIDLTGWTIVFDVRQQDASPDPALVQKTASIVGVYDAVRATNTQRARVILADTETGVFSAGTYRHSWKRTNDGSETILAFGKFIIRRATQI